MEAAEQVEQVETGLQLLEVKEYLVEVVAFQLAVMVV